MSLYSSFYASLSGLATNANSLSVIGNNLANLNTIGFKGSSSTFQDMFNAAALGNGTSGNGNPIQIGLGSQLASINQNFGQGSFQSTSNTTDMGLSGTGFFMLQTPSGGRVYSRAGNFSLDHDGNLIDPSGNNVLGWNATAGAITNSGALTPIHINLGASSQPIATDTITMTTNLNASASTGSTFTAPISIYDSLGATHNLTATYTKTGTGTWSMALSVDDTGATVTPATTVLTFDNAGNMTSPTGAITIGVTGWSDGAAASSISWNPATDVSSFATDSSITTTTQNGMGGGNITSVTVDQDGKIIGAFTNGQTMALAQVSLASFTNQAGLSKLGNNCWSETLASGTPAIGVANQAGRGQVLGSQLELSNVDVASEFTQLIVNQRGYQANSRVVTTTDDLLQETLNLKR
ncbi:flagellar hook protein FlgE [Holophaga foetida]|uniref:flagellar hook protein FlgE n=1 Tax=Holophaga foetida TaxID=35839 RepID=UPI00024742DC|nr:flagellar hook protein FlgE [Holophaga foetida]